MRCLFRKEKLQEAHQLQLFKANQRLLLEWTVKQSSEMAEKNLPKTRAEAERLIIEHQDWKVSRLCRTSTPHDHMITVQTGLFCLTDGDRRPRRAYRLCSGVWSKSDQVRSHFKDGDPEGPEPAGGSKSWTGPRLAEPEHDPGAGPDPAGDELMAGR